MFGRIGKAHEPNWMGVSIQPADVDMTGMSAFLQGLQPSRIAWRLPQCCCRGKQCVLYW